MSKKHNKPETKVEQVEVQTLEDALGLADEVATEPTQDQDEQIEQIELALEDTIPADTAEDATEEVELEDERGVLVLDTNGMPLYRKLKPTYAAAEVKGKPRLRAASQAPTRVKQYEVGGNAALITFPTDRYGITKDIKTAIIRAASRIAGDPHKKALVDEVLAILSKHVEIKFNADRAYREKLAKADK